MTAPDDRDDLLAPGTPIDLDNCAREPIHIPGSVQPRGCLLVVQQPDLVVTQVSANLEDIIGVPADQAPGAPLAAVVGTTAAEVIGRAGSSFGDLRERNPIAVTLEIDGHDVVFDAILHREDTSKLLLLELEAAEGPRPFSFPNSYLAVRGTVAELDRATSLGELYEITARAVRTLTGFDRVMVYRYDADFNGEVVAEDRREDLNSFLGLHYPASDIPAQARALYEKNWIRLIDDVDYRPAPLVPADNPVTGGPIDLTHASLRSVSPIHIEYLKNMGVGASMSISLLRDGRLWGLIACHHYSGPHRPPYAVRAAAEFLGSTLSVRLVDRAEDDELQVRRGSQDVLSKLTAAAFSEAVPLADALLGAPNLLDLLPADGVALSIEGRPATLGSVPPPQRLDELVAWVREREEDVVVTDCLGVAAPELELDPAVASGVLALTLRDGQYVMWLRAEEEHTVDWGGDPHNKAIARREGDEVRLSPRKSFDRWREVVRGRSARWTAGQVDDAATLRSHVVETLYLRAQREIRLAETLQRSLLPALPEVAPWSLSAHYEPAAGGRIGGDWYDAFEVGGRLALVLGDVAGHGVAAAGTMSQLRNVLRGYVVEALSEAEDSPSGAHRAVPDPDGDDPEGAGPAVAAVRRLNDYVVRMVPDAFATLTLCLVDRATGEVDGVIAGHPRPVVARRGRVVDLSPVASPPVGVPRATYRRSGLRLEPGDCLLLYSDGLIERRDEDLDDGMHRLAAAVAGLHDEALARSGDAEGTPAQRLFADVVGTGAGDDATVIVLHRPPAAG